VTVTDETGGAVAAVDAASDGTYSVDLRPGTYNATADAPDFDTQTVADIAVSPNATASESFALIPQRGSLSGMVTNATDSEAIPDATITVDGERTATTDANGTYALDALERGEREITVSADGYAQKSQTLTFTANDTRELNVSLSPRGAFVITQLSGDDEIEQGSSGGFGLTVRNDGRVTDDASVDVTLNRSGSVSPNPVVIGDVAVGDTESESVSVSLGSSAATGTYAVTATTPDSEKTLTFVAVSSDDAESDGGGTAGGGGGTAGAGPAPPPSTEDPDEPENATDDPTNETDDPTNATDDPTNATDDPTDGEDDPVDGELADGDDENNAEDDGIDTESGVATDGESGGDDTSDEDESADGTPGFGPAIGVLAIFGAAFLVGRRGDAAVASNSRTSSRVERARTEAKRAQKRRRKRKPPRRDAQSRSKATMRAPVASDGLPAYSSPSLRRSWPRYSSSALTPLISRTLRSSLSSATWKACSAPYPSPEPPTCPSLVRRRI